MPNDQLEVEVREKIEVLGAASRFIADDSLSFSKMHRLGLVITNGNPVKSSLQNNCTISAIKLETS